MLNSVDIYIYKQEKFSAADYLSTRMRCVSYLEVFDYSTQYIRIEMCR